MATTQADRELNERLAALTRTIAQGNGSLQQAAKDAAARMLHSQDDVIDAYEDQLRKQRNWTTKEGKATLDRLVRLKKLELQEESIRREHSIKNKEFTKRLGDVGREQAVLAAKIATANNSNNNVLKAKLAADQQQLALRQQAIEQERLVANADIVARHRIAKEAGKELVKLEASQLTRSAKAGEMLRTSMSAAVSKAFGGATLGQTVLKALGTVEEAISAGMKTGGYGIDVKPESMGGSKFNTYNMAALGFDPAEAIKMQAENRRVILSSTNGITEFVGGLEDAHERLRDSLTSPLERSQFAIDSYNISVKSGIRMQKSQATMFAKNAELTSKYTGDSVTAFTKNVGEIMESESIRSNLMGAANESQRIALLASVQAQYTNNRMLGMSAEQAKKTAIALAELEGQDKKDLLRQGAELQMFAAVLGMGGKGSRFRQLHMQGEDKSDSERIEYQAIINEMNNKYSQRTWGKTTGDKIALQGIAKSIDFAKIKKEAFNTNLNKAASPQEQAFATLPQIPEEMKKAASTYGDIRTILDKSLEAQLAIKTAMYLLTGSSAMGAGASIASLFSTTAAASTATTAAGAIATGGATVTAGLVAATVAAVAAGGTAIYAGYKAAKGEDSSNWISEGVDKLTGGAVTSWVDSLVNSEFDAKVKQLDAQLAETQKKIIKKEQPTKPTDAKPAPTEEKKEDEGKKNVMDSAKRADLANDFLKTISELSQKQLDISEKQLVALTMSENERAKADNTAKLRKDNRFATKYGYI